MSFPTIMDCWSYGLLHKNTLYSINSSLLWYLQTGLRNDENKLYYGNILWRLSNIKYLKGKNKNAMIKATLIALTQFS